MLRRRITALVLASTIVSIASVGVSHAEVIERVVAVVNDDAIFLSELRQKAAPCRRPPRGSGWRRSARSTRRSSIA